MLTGVSINTSLTKAEMELTPKRSYFSDYDEVFVRTLNGKTLELLSRVIEFQKQLISLVSQCKMFIPLYLELLRHITHEAEHYMEELKALNAGERPHNNSSCYQIDFWNNIMMEHAEFIDGLLDPTEKTLKDAAQTFVARFEALVGKCVEEAGTKIVEQSKDATSEIKAFKAAATEGLLLCKIESIIPPLLADHVLREANHFLRLLG
ncbi:MAG: DUF2935 domain-containing protein, partial [Clostridiales bacterium]|nr:DUF2935 domain-containing protein [Clostridiales bacterium]